jgi:cytochrome P450 enzyme
VRTNQGDLTSAAVSFPAVSEDDGFAPYSAAYAAHPHAAWHKLRQRGPVLSWGSALLVTRYDAVASVLIDPRFSLRLADWEEAPPPPVPGRESAYELFVQHGLFSVPRADHLRLRKLVSPSFGPRAVERRRHHAQLVVDKLIGDISDDRPFDVVRDFAQPLPLRLISDFLGIPAEHAELFGRFAQAAVDASAPSLPRDKFEGTIAAVAPGLDLLHSLIEDRRRHPTDDLLGELVRAEQDGGKLTTQELVSLVGSLITAGAETTVHLLAFAVLNLHRHPDQQELVRNRPELLKNALYEVLRYDNFGRLGVARFALDDMELLGGPVRKGQLVYPMLGSALRDPTVFSNPDVFDITRDQSRNNAFGQGLHYCLGASLALLEGEVALAGLMRRFPVIEVVGGPEYEFHHQLRKITSLTIRTAGFRGPVPASP